MIPSLYCTVPQPCSEPSTSDEPPHGITFLPTSLLRWCLELTNFFTLYNIFSHKNTFSVPAYSFRSDEFVCKSRMLVAAEMKWLGETSRGGIWVVKNCVGWNLLLWRSDCELRLGWLFIILYDCVGFRVWEILEFAGGEGGYLRFW